MLKWPHAPAHLKKGTGAYMVTSGTYLKQHLFNNREKMLLLTSAILEVTEEFGWALQAWAVFPNHYHFVAHSPAESGDLKKLIKKLHANTARSLNRMDDTEGRKVWHNYWDTPLTFERSYFSRLHYVHENPVKHKVSRRAEDYEWCSASWLLRTAKPSLIETIRSFPIDRLNVEDDF